MTRLFGWLAWLLRRLHQRVPLRQQLTVTECGAACLAMVAAYHGRDVTVSEVRRKLAPGRDGLSAEQILQAAQELLFSV